MLGYHSVHLLLSAAREANLMTVELGNDLRVEQNVIWNHFSDFFFFFFFFQSCLVPHYASGPSSLFPGHPSNVGYRLPLVV